MRKKKYIYDVIVQILLIVVVMQIFKQNPDRIQASYWAGALFVLLPISMMAREWIFSRWLNKLWWFGALQFWLLFALPIFALRIQYPRTSLDTISVMGVPMKLWHQMSNGSYMLLLLISVWSAIQAHRLEKK